MPHSRRRDGCCSEDKNNHRAAVTTYRISPHFTIEIRRSDPEEVDVYATKENNGTTSIEYWTDGSLRSIGFFQFTGRLILHRSTKEETTTTESNNDDNLDGEFASFVTATEDSTGNHEVLGTSSTISDSSSSHTTSIQGLSANNNDNRISSNHNNNKILVATDHMDSSGVSANTAREASYRSLYRSTSTPPRGRVPLPQPLQQPIIETTIPHSQHPNEERPQQEQHQQQPNNRSDHEGSSDALELTPPATTAGKRISVNKMKIRHDGDYHDGSAGVLFSANGDHESPLDFYPTTDLHALEGEEQRQDTPILSEQQYRTKNAELVSSPDRTVGVSNSDRMVRFSNIEHEQRHNQPQPPPPSRDNEEEASNASTHRLVEPQESSSSVEDVGSDESVDQFDSGSSRGLHASSVLTSLTTATNSLTGILRKKSSTAATSVAAATCAAVKPVPRFQRHVKRFQRLRNVWNIANVHHQDENQCRDIIPEVIRIHRHAVRMSSPKSGSTPLHDLCALPDVTLDELMECANQHPQAVSTVDALGRYPLHILGDNETLILNSLSSSTLASPSSRPRDAVTVFCGHLIHEFPRAAITTDHEGFIPFTRIVADWIDWVHDESKQQAYEQRQQQQQQPAQPQADSEVQTSNIQSNSRNDHDNSGNNSSATPSNLNHVNKVKRIYYSTRMGIFSKGRSNALQVSTGSGVSTSPFSHSYPWSYQRKFFPRVKVWEEVEWCLTMLSTALEILGHRGSQRNNNNDNNNNNNNNPIPNTYAPTIRPHEQRRRTSVAREARSSIRGTRSSMAKSSRQNPGSPQDSPVDEAPVDDRQVLMDNVVEKLPNLVCAVLLVDDDGENTRERLLDTLIFRRLFLCPKTIGIWLIDMLNYGGSPAKRAVDFLWYISHTSMAGHKSIFGSPPHVNEPDTFFQDRQDVFAAVGSLKGIIASLVTLDTKETDRATSTAVVWNVMNQKLKRPFVLGLLLIDLMLHIILMVAFRPIATPKAELSQLGVHPSTVIFVIVVHYLLRKSCEAWVLLSISPLVLRAYFGNMWIVFDSIATILTLWATIWHMRSGLYHNGLNSLVVGVLWIKVLGFLKVVNKEMSTFILALSQILNDIRLFMVVLVVIVIMFADMFFIAVSTKDNGEYCANLNVDYDHEAGTMDDFCNSPFDSYLRVYSILLGDFELDNMTATPGTTVLFIMFTVFGVIILLNVLIAIISDSYEKATMSGALLFGRARVLYVAQNEALERFLQPRGQPGSMSGYSPSVAKSDCSKMSRCIVRWAVLVIVVVTATYALLFAIGLLVTFGTNKLWFSFSTALAIILPLSCALWVVSTSILDGILRDMLPDRAEHVYDAIGRINNWIVRNVSHFLFGLGKEKVHTMSMNGQVEEDWTGRVKYLENVIERMVSETKVELKSEIMEMRAEVHEIHAHITVDKTMLSRNRANETTRY